MKALTLWRPWPFAIFHLRDNPKRVENRGWKPPRFVMGQEIAIHAGQRFDRDSADEIALMNGWSSLTGNPRATAEGIIGTVRVVGWVHGQTRYGHAARLLDCDGIDQAAGWEVVKSRWFCGPYGWVLADVRELPASIPCKGAQGLWDVPADVLARIEATP